ncbi:MAG: 16S rRNA (guanine(966)-N(2))-methyltransferase RsmD [Coriobacteriia bacterium]|nr:16S rRNA (guanine(966)-N(2))-methyltransferase RsmD [Coriobacteriia bacterium]
MRIISGSLRGRHLEAPRGQDTTRPTSDRVREAVFSALTSRLGPGLAGGAVLDAFAGSGALGLEALSRGCASATFVELDSAAVMTVRSNVTVLGVGTRACIVAGDAIGLATRNAIPGGPFTLLLLDPPYRLGQEVVAGLLSALAMHGRIQDGAVVVFEHAVGIEPLWAQDFQLEWRKRYGTTEVDIAVYEKGTGAS